MIELAPPLSAMAMAMAGQGNNGQGNGNSQGQGQGHKVMGGMWAAEVHDYVPSSVLAGGLILKRQPWSREGAEGGFRTRTERHQEAGASQRALIFT
jgi:hypothetical protein